jgi:hypothetical protein
MPLLSQTATGSRQAAARNQVIPKVGRQGVIEPSHRDPQDARSRAYVPTPDNHEGVVPNRHTPSEEVNDLRGWRVEPLSPSPAIWRPSSVEWASLITSGNTMTCGRCKRRGVDLAHVEDCHGLESSQPRRLRREPAGGASKRSTTGRAKARNSRQPKTRHSIAPQTVGRAPTQRIAGKAETCKSCGGRVDPMSGACRC